MYILFINYRFFFIFSNPDNVAMCILPMGTDDEDVTNHIQHTLVEAFCWENDIPLIKVSIYSYLFIHSKKYKLKKLTNDKLIYRSFEFD